MIAWLQACRYFRQRHIRLRNSVLILTVRVCVCPGFISWLYSASWWGLQTCHSLHFHRRLIMWPLLTVGQRRRKLGTSTYSRMSTNWLYIYFFRSKVMHYTVQQTVPFQCNLSSPLEKCNLMHIFLILKNATALTYWQSNSSPCMSGVEKWHDVYSPTWTNC